METEDEKINIESTRRHNAAKRRASRSALGKTRSAKRRKAATKRVRVRNRRCRVNIDTGVVDVGDFVPTKDQHLVTTSFWNADNEYRGCTTQYASWLKSWSDDPAALIQLMNEATPQRVRAVLGKPGSSKGISSNTFTRSIQSSWQARVPGILLAFCRTTSSPDLLAPLCPCSWPLLQTGSKVYEPYELIQDQVVILSGTKEFLKYTAVRANLNESALDTTEPVGALSLAVQAI